MTFNKSVLAIVTIAAAALLSAGSVFAQEATPDTWMNAGLSGKSRAEVSAELAAARKSGLTKSWSAGYLEPVNSHLLRAQVKSTTQQAIHSGEVKAINAEVYSFTPVASQKLAQAGK
jgi:hypothetical protein